MKDIVKKLREGLRAEITRLRDERRDAAMSNPIHGEVTIERAELLRILSTLRSVTSDLRELMEDGFRKPPRRKCNADEGSAYQNWLEDKWESLERASAVLEDTDHLV